MTRTTRTPEAWTVYPGVTAPPDCAESAIAGVVADATGMPCTVTRIRVPVTDYTLAGDPEVDGHRVSSEARHTGPWSYDIIAPAHSPDAWLDGLERWLSADDISVIAGWLS